jgi:hypothetical protein
LIRGLYAVALFSLLISYRVGWLESFEAAGHLVDLIRSFSPVMIGAWLGYTLIYVAAGVLAIRRSRYVVPVFILAMTVDYSVWLSATMNPSYDMILSGVGTLLDTMVNVLDMIFLLLLLVYEIRGRAENA